MSLHQTDYKRSLAYRRLGIKPEHVRIEPFFRSNLRGIARCLNQATKVGEPVCPVEPFRYLQGSNDPDASKVFTAYRSVPASYRRLLPPEAFCHAAGVPPTRVLEIITGIAVSMNVRSVTILAALSQPRIVQKTVEMALRDDGVRERLILHKAMGLLPTWGWRGISPEQPITDAPTRADIFEQKLS